MILQFSSRRPAQEMSSINIVAMAWRAMYHTLATFLEHAFCAAQEILGTFNAVSSTIGEVLGESTYLSMTIALTLGNLLEVIRSKE